MVRSVSGLTFHGLVWALAAMVTTGVSGLVLAVQPLVVMLARRGKGAGTRHVLGAFLGPLLATILGAVSLFVIDDASDDVKQRLDAIALLLPVTALATWIGVTFALLRRRVA